MADESGEKTSPDESNNNRVGENGVVLPKLAKLDMDGDKKTDDKMETESSDSLAADEEDSSVEDNEEDEDFYGDGFGDEDLFSIDDDPVEMAPKLPPPKDISPLEFSMETFKIVEYLPPAHKFASATFTSSQTFVAAYNRDVKILRENLPSGIWIRGYEQRMDLFSVLIAGPQKTPYEGSLFAFEIQLTDQYPKQPPLFHYLSFHKHRINPNLYVEGKVCVSLLGTWHGQKACEKWTANSTLLQVVLSIQGLILVPEPYFNEPGCEKSLGTPIGTKASRDYNEKVLLHLMVGSVEMLKKPPSPWQLEITRFLKQFTPKTVERTDSWLKKEEEGELASGFPLQPIACPSKFRSAIKSLQDAVTTYCAAVAV